jgi:hypothetical protein
LPQVDNRDVVLQVPDEWEDRSVVAFEAPRAPGAFLATNVALMRLDTKASSVLTFVTQQVATLASSLPKFELVSQRDVTFGGLPAVEILYHWRPPDGALTQRITVFQREGKLWSFTATALRQEFPLAKPTFDKIAASVRFPSPRAS